MTQVKTAMVLAAGLGKRMRPLTLTIPKPMVQVAGRSLIDRQIDLLVEVGVERIVVNTHYLPVQIEAHLSKRKDAEILFSREDVLLETGGGVRKALPLLGSEPFLVTSSDVIFEDASGYTALQKAYNDTGALLLQPFESAWGYDGVGDFDLNGTQIAWRNGESASHVFTTAQIFNPAIFADERVQALQEIFSLREVYKLFLPKLVGVENASKWFHVGTVQAVEELNRLQELQKLSYNS